MGLPNIFNTGRSGMQANKAAMATTGHNISNANSEGYSRQRVTTTPDRPEPYGSKGFIGKGTLVSRVDRMNDEYVEKQVRDAGRGVAHMEEKDLVLRQTEDIFNEMNGDGLNRLMSRLFNEFRKLANDPDNEAVRQSVREASQSVVNDFKRLRKEVDEVRRHIDSRLEGAVREVNSLAVQLKDINIKIKVQEAGGAPAADLQDKRDNMLRQLASYMDCAMHKDGDGNYAVDIRGVGPLVVGPNAEQFEVYRSPADGEGKSEGALDLKTSANARGIVTHQLKGGKMGALLDVRDNTLSTILNRLDEMAYNLSDSINQIHSQGFTRFGTQGTNFFKPLAQRERAAEFIDLSDEVKSSVNHIAAASIPDAPGDNRIAIAIAGLQSMKMMNEGRATADDFYNSIVSDVGVASAKNRNDLNQHKDIQTQLNKIRDNISGVSIDEETANLMQYQHAFDASAKIIAVADECMKTVLDLKR
jgi:flagellar hook-associated protein 1